MNTSCILLIFAFIDPTLPAGWAGIYYFRNAFIETFDWICDMTTLPYFSYFALNDLAPPSDGYENIIFVTCSPFIAIMWPFFNIWFLHSMTPPLTFSAYIYNVLLKSLTFYLRRFLWMKKHAPAWAYILFFWSGETPSGKSPLLVIFHDVKIYI